ncbi:MAG: MBOAT family protein, partial [Oscillospiraceae bacterium]|nr:MBOAT family protein [Oscillospiraceae bacterium]
MVFSSMPFVYFFFPLVFIAYFMIPNRVWRNTVLLIASLVFYSWGEPKFVALMLCAVLVAWLGGLLLHRFGEQGRLRLKKLVFVVTVVLLVGNLFVFKYLN